MVAESTLANDWLSRGGGRSLGQNMKGDVVILNFPFSDLR